MTSPLPYMHIVRLISTLPTSCLEGELTEELARFRIPLYNLYERASEYARDKKFKSSSSSTVLKFDRMAFQAHKPPTNRTRKSSSQSCSTPSTRTSSWLKLRSINHFDSADSVHNFRQLQPASGFSAPVSARLQRDRHGSHHEKGRQSVVAVHRERQQCGFERVPEPATVSVCFKPFTTLHLSIAKLKNACGQLASGVDGLGGSSLCAADIKVRVIDLSSGQNLCWYWQVNVNVTIASIFLWTQIQFSVR
eukprot:gene39758-49136_t